MPGNIGVHLVVGIGLELISQKRFDGIEKPEYLRFRQRPAEEIGHDSSILVAKFRNTQDDIRVRTTGRVNASGMWVEDGILIPGKVKAWRTIEIIGHENVLAMAEQGIVIPGCVN